MLVLIWIHFLLLHTKVGLVREKAITSGSAILATNTWFHISQNSKMLLEVLCFFSIHLHENDVDGFVGFKIRTFVPTLSVSPDAKYLPELEIAIVPIR